MRKLSVLLASALVAVALVGCGKTPNEEVTPTNTPVPTKEATPDPTKVPEPTKEPEVPAVTVEAGTQFNAIADFNYEAGQEGVWQYYFSGDNGETYDACGSFDDYGGVSGWHPWEGSYIGVGFNQDVEGFLELNTDCLSKNFSGQMGVLTFEAPATGKYVITARVWNPWEQPCDLVTFKKDDGTVALTYDMSETIDIYAYVTPTDVQLEAGQKLYIYCNSTGDDWVSAYVDVTMVYEPTDDSVYTVPEVEAPVIIGVEPNFEQEAQHNAYKDFSTESNDGTWVYASTENGTDFALAPVYEDRDYGAHQWFTEDGSVGVGTVDYFEDGEQYVELNTAGTGTVMSALGFKAPADGTYVLNGYAFNAWNQPTELVHAVLNGTEVATVELVENIKLPNEFSFEVTMKAGETVYFYCPSTVTAEDGGWVSAYISVFANAQ